MLIPLRTHHTLECGENFYSANHTPKTIGFETSTMTEARILCTIILEGRMMYMYI